MVTGLVRSGLSIGPQSTSPAQDFVSPQGEEVLVEAVGTAGGRSAKRGEEHYLLEGGRPEP